MKYFIFALFLSVSLFGAGCLLGGNKLWSGFYYRGVTDSKESVEFILLKPAIKSRVGEFDSLEGCENWAKTIRSNIKHAPMEAEDMFYCVQGCTAGKDVTDCAYRTGVVNVFKKQ